LFPYWLLFSFFAIGSIQFRERNALFGRTTPLLPLAIAFTALMIGLRYEVGGDWSNYIDIYADFKYQELGHAIRMQDPGYALLNWAGAKLDVGIWFINSVCAAIFCWGLLKFARAQPNPWLAIAVAVPYLIIVVAMGYTRQAVAIGIILAALSRIEPFSLLRFFVYVLIAATFHKSAVILLPLVALAANRHKVLTGVIVAGLAVVLYYLFLEESSDRMVAGYITAQYSSQGAAIRIIMNLPPALIFLKYHHHFRLKQTELKVWRNLPMVQS
jgi:hypothetical protein